MAGHRASWARTSIISNWRHSVDIVWWFRGLFCSCSNIGKHGRRQAEEASQDVMAWGKVVTCIQKDAADTAAGKKK